MVCRAGFGACQRGQNPHSSLTIRTNTIGQPGGCEGTSGETRSALLRPDGSRQVPRQHDHTPGRGAGTSAGVMRPCRQLLKDLRIGPDLGRLAAVFGVVFRRVRPRQPRPTPRGRGVVPRT